MSGLEVVELSNEDRLFIPFLPSWTHQPWKRGGIWSRAGGIAVRFVVVETRKKMRTDAQYPKLHSFAIALRQSPTSAELVLPFPPPSCCIIKQPSMVSIGLSFLLSFFLFFLLLVLPGMVHAGLAGPVGFIVCEAFFV